MKKRIIFVLGIMSLGLLNPSAVSATTSSVLISCNSTTLKANEDTVCTITGKSDYEVSGLSLKLGADAAVSITDIKADSSWQGDGDGGQFALYTDSNKKGEFAIGTFTIKVGNVTTDQKVTISTNDITFSNADFDEVAVSNSSISIQVITEVSSTGTSTDKENTTNMPNNKVEDAPTNQPEVNTGGNADENSDVSTEINTDKNSVVNTDVSTEVNTDENSVVNTDLNTGIKVETSTETKPATKEEVVKNPNTGLYVSCGVALVAIISVGVFMLLKKKNFFKNI